MVPSKLVYGIGIRFKMEIFDLSIRPEHVYAILAVTELNFEIPMEIFGFVTEF